MELNKFLKKAPAGLGIIALAANGESLHKKSLLCRTGSFDGLYGPVEVTKEKLEAIASKYNTQRAKPQNENDYAPILTDHIREVDRIKGRILAGLCVEQWTDPETGNTEWGLFGDLRVDKPEAKEKVESGEYAQLSISFDEDTFELYEVSFVAVEAARRSIVLSKKQVPENQGVKMELQQKVNSLMAKQKKIASSLAARGSSMKALSQNIEKQRTEISALSSKAQDLLLGFKKASLSAQLSHLVRLGKMTPAEKKAIDVGVLAALPEAAQKIALSAYQGRKPSSDLGQRGQVGADAPKVKALSASDMRKAIEAQKKGLKSLSADEDKPASTSQEGGDNEAGSDDVLSNEEIGNVTKQAEEIIAKLSALLEQQKANEDELKKLSAEDDKINEEIKEQE